MLITNKRSIKTRNIVLLKIGMTRQAPQTVLICGACVFGASGFCIFIRNICILSQQIAVDVQQKTTDAEKNLLKSEIFSRPPFLLLQSADPVL